MGRRSRKDIALRAATNFYGLSSATNSFPKGVQVDIFTGSGNGEFRGVIAKLVVEVEKAWNENIGSLSRTARLSNQDIKFLSKRIGLKTSDNLIEEWMQEIAKNLSSVYLVTIKKGKEKKLLLVNTDKT